MSAGPCLCGATDCPSCGPAQGYSVKRRPSGGFYNPTYCDKCAEEVEAHEVEEIHGKTLCPECVAGLDADWRSIGMLSEALTENGGQMPDAIQALLQEETPSALAIGQLVIANAKEYAARMAVKNI